MVCAAPDIHALQPPCVASLLRPYGAKRLLGGREAGAIVAIARSSTDTAVPLGECREYRNIADEVVLEGVTQEGKGFRMRLSADEARLLSTACGEGGPDRDGAELNRRTDG